MAESSGAMAMDQYEVSRRPGITLAQALEAEDVPMPGLMRFQGWLAWRGTEGLRPARKKGDTAGTSGGFEADLWRRTMELVHGSNWKVELEAKEIAELEPSSDGEELVPDGPEDEESVPGVAPKAAARRDASSPPASRLSSSAGDGSDAASKLRAKLELPFVPSAEDFATYSARVQRIGEALNLLDSPLPEGTVESLLFRAEVMGELGGAADPLRHLKVRFAEELADGSDTTEAQRRLSVLVKMIQEHGGKLSSQADKLFSSEEGTPDRAKETRSPPVARTLFKGPEATESGKGPPENLVKGLASGHQLGGQSSSSSGDALAEVLKKQTEILQAALEKKPPKRSTIQVTPKVQWPVLDDDCSDFRSVQEFYEQFEATIALANDGEGMTDMEALVTLKACLRQHRLKSYELIYKRHLNDGTLREDPGAVYKAVKQKHLLFSETREEKELRVLDEWERLQKGRLSAHQWEVLWEERLGEREQVGLGMTARENLIQYLRKIGDHLSREVRKDKRYRESSEGAREFRGVATWEEAHEVVQEIEAMNAGQRALQNSSLSMGGPLDANSPEDSTGKRRHKKGNQQGQSGQEESTLALDANAKKKKVCFNMRDHGSCKNGDRCEYSHDKAFVEAERKKKKEAERAAKQNSDSAAAASSGKGKGKGKEKGGGNSKGGKGGGKGNQGKKQPCRFWLTSRGCDKGDACPNKHDQGARKRFLAEVAKAAKGSGVPGVQLASVEGPTGVGSSSSDMACANPFVCFESVCVGSEPQRSVSAPVVTDSVARAQAAPAPSKKQKPLKNKGKGGGRGTKADGSDLESIDDLPKSWFATVPNSRGGYQYKTEVDIMGRTVPCMLDTCAGCNSVSEEMVIGMIKVALRSGIPPSSTEFPVAALEKWPIPEVVNGLAKDSPIPLKGGVVLRVRLKDKRRGGKVKEILVRAKVLGKGSSTWHGLILGGRALDAADRGGLGFHPGATAHVLEAVDVHLPRLEDAEPYGGQDKAYPFCAVETTVYDTVWNMGSCENPTSDLSSCEGLGLLAKEDVRVDAGDVGSWVKVCLEDSEKSLGGSPGEAGVVLPIQLPDLEFEATPGLWPVGETEGIIFLESSTENGFTVTEGSPVAVVTPSVAVQKACCECGAVMAEAWTFPDTCCHGAAWCPEMDMRCDSCGSRTESLVKGGCEECAAASGAAKSRPGRPRASAGAVFALWAMISWLVPEERLGDQVLHIMEDVSSMARMAETLPTDEYYSLLRSDMGLRHPKVDPHLLDHLETLEAFLDTSIMAGVSFGVEKAKIAVMEGELLGHVVGRKGASAQKEKTLAIVKFPPLKEKVQVQQFLGCTNFLRYYLQPQNAHCGKILGEYVKGAKEFPEEGLGPGNSPGDLAVRAIKLMARRTIELSVLDEVAAVTGERPLEQVADSSGYAVGGVAVQLREDLRGFEVLATHSKGLTPPQQAWAPLSLETYAQLEVRRAVKGMIGPLRCIMWTDHSNLTRLQTSEEIQPKHLRWLSELLADGSVLRSLSGRSAKLADGLSRNPPERDELLSQRTKDLQGLIGQLRGFSLEEFLGEEEPGRVIPWSLLSDVDAAVEPKDLPKGPKVFN